jgi:hypothetical protein
MFFKNDPKARGNATHRVIKNLVGEDQKLFESYKIITELIPFTKGFEEKIIAKAYDKSKDQKISMLKQAIIKNADSYVKKTKEVVYLSKTKSKYVRELVNKFVIEVLKEADEEAFKSFVDSSENLECDIDSDTISNISNQFNHQDQD